MGNTGLLATWLRWGWIAAYAVVIAVHLFHAAAMDTQQRAWHGGHVLMAVGMVEMFLPSGLKPVPSVVGETVFAVAAVTVLVWMGERWRSARPVNLLWTISLVDMAAMAYMFGFPGTAFRPLTGVFVVYYAVVAVAWMAGALDDTRERRLPLALGPRASVVPVAPLAGVTSLAERATLCAMAAGMAYMFVGMSFM